MSNSYSADEEISSRPLNPIGPASIGIDSRFLIVFTFYFNIWKRSQFLPEPIKFLSFSNPGKKLLPNWADDLYHTLPYELFHLFTENIFASVGSS